MTHENESSWNLNDIGTIKINQDFYRWTVNTQICLHICCPFSCWHSLRKCRRREIHFRKRQTSATDMIKRLNKKCKNESHRGNVKREERNDLNGMATTILKRMCPKTFISALYFTVQSLKSQNVWPRPFEGNVHLEWWKLLSLFLWTCHCRLL